MKRRFRSLLLAVLSVVLSICLSACWMKEADNASNTVRLNLVTGETEALGIKGLDDDYTWSSQYETVAIVNEAGEIVAKEPGKTTITVKSGSDEYQFIVIVKKNSDKNADKSGSTDEDEKTRETAKSDVNKNSTSKNSTNEDTSNTEGLSATPETGKKHTSSNGGASADNTTDSAKQSGSDADPDNDTDDTELTGAEKRAKEREQAGSDGSNKRDGAASQKKLPQNNQPVLYVDDASAKAGDKGVKLAIKVLRNPGILGMSFAIHFDETALTLTKATNGSALKDVLDLTTGKKLEDGCKFAWDGVEISGDQIKDGDVLVLTFDVADSAKSGVYGITISCEDGDIVNGKLVPVDMQLVDGSITV